MSALDMALQDVQSAADLPTLATWMGLRRSVELGAVVLACSLMAIEGFVGAEGSFLASCTFDASFFGWWFSQLGFRCDATGGSGTYRVE
jgi:hypothetical protein